MRIRLQVLLVLSAGLAGALFTAGCSSKSSSSTTSSAVSVSVSPTTATLAAGATQTFTATVTNDGTTTPGVTWTASTGTITSAGVYTAPTPVAAASATITATSKTDTTKTATATVTLTPISVSVSPSTATVAGSATQQFTATVTGDTVLNQGVTWTATSGTISAAGLYTAPANIPTTTTATVTATSKTDTSKTNTATVTLPAVSISTTSLPNATTTVAYSQSLSATGGSAPYTWSLVSGAGVPPGGLTLSAAGVISGTPGNPITVTGSFTVKVTDSASNTATKVLTLVSGPALTPGTNNSELNGTYGFLVQGMYNLPSPPVAGKVYGETVIGSITLNGTGAVTSGSLDNYDSRNASSSTTVTGSYTLGSDNRGVLILNSGTRSFTFDIAAAGISGGIANRLKLVQFEDNVSTALGQAVATGFAKIQTSAAFLQLNGSYVFGIDGETSCTGCATVTVAPFGSVAMAGTFSASGGTINSGTADAHAFNANYNSLALSGTTVAPATGTGRGTLTLAVTGPNFPTMPTHFVYYVLNANEILIASTDAHNVTSSASGMLAGSMQAQTVNSYGASTLGGGNIIAYQDYENGGNGTTNYSLYSGAIILEIQLTANSNAFSALADQNDGNNSAPALGVNYTGLTYNLATNGRLTVSGGGSNTPIFYFSAAGTGYGVDQSAGGDGGLYVMSPQTGAPFSASTSAGVHAAVVSLPPSVTSQGSFTGIAIYSSPGGTLTYTQDYVQAGTLSPGNVISLSYALDAVTGATTGRGTVSNSVFYFVNPNKAIAIDSTATGAPNITIIENSTATNLAF